MAIADEKYVLLITFRKNGEGVPTPVWIAPLPDGTAGFTTEPESGKTKRIRNNPRVTLQPCSARGKVTPGSVVVEATAEVLLGDDASPVEVAIVKKYWVLARLIGLSSVWRKVRRKPEPVRCAIRLTNAHLTS